MIKKFVLVLGLAALLLAGAVQAQTTRYVPVFTSAASTAATRNSADFIVAAGNGITCVFDVSVYTSGNFTLTIQGKDGLSGKYYTLLAGAAVSSVSTNVYKVFRGAPVTANVSANDQLPSAWRISIAGAASPSATYTVGCATVQ